jgi:hypothetical protein
LVCPLGKVEDVYTFAEDGEEPFPPAVLAALRPEERERLVMVVYCDQEALSKAKRQIRFCLLEESAESLQVFLECMRLLCIYAESAN